MEEKYLAIPEGNPNPVAEEIINLLVKQRVVPEGRAEIRHSQKSQQPVSWIIREKSNDMPKDRRVYASLDWVGDRYMLLFSKELSPEIAKKVYSGLSDFTINISQR